VKTYIQIYPLVSLILLVISCVGLIAHVNQFYREHGIKQIVTCRLSLAEYVVSFIKLFITYSVPGLRVISTLFMLYDQESTDDMLRKKIYEAEKVVFEEGAEPVI
jgi:hypothetical protein